MNLAGTNPLLDGLMLSFTTLGLAYVLALLAVPLWWRGRRVVALDLLLLLAITLAVTEGIKVATGRPRPCEALSDVLMVPLYGCPLEANRAFPSGHTSRAFAVAALLALRFPLRKGSAAFVAAGLIGVSRIYLGVHWPSDVLAGAVLGGMMALLLEVVDRRVPAYRAGKERLLRSLDTFLGRRRAGRTSNLKLASEELGGPLRGVVHGPLEGGRKGVDQGDEEGAGRDVLRDEHAAVRRHHDPIGSGLLQPPVDDVQGSDQGRRHRAEVVHVGFLREDPRDRHAGAGDDRARLRP